MELQQVSPSCYAILAGNNRLCDANSGFVRRAGGVVIDTQSDLGHARHLRDLVQQVFKDRPRRVINTHEDIDHVAGNAVFDGPRSSRTAACASRSTTPPIRGRCWPCSASSEFRC
jgi:glyoxylase-like metal-dependent hydrolase (beta-lactamase superfamily II)